MNELQEWRDRCARAMGWTDIESNGEQGPGWLESPGGRLAVQKGSWKPDEDYNQAMMMRERCRGLDEKYFSALKELVMGIPGLSNDYGRETSFATARQIAEAALKVLENNDG